MKTPTISVLAAVALSYLVLPVYPAHADDQPQWAERHTRNMVSAETDLPSTFDIETGVKIKWSVPLGGRAYGPATIAGDMVYVGANNSDPRDPRHKGDRGVLLCLRQ